MLALRAFTLVMLLPGLLGAGIGAVAGAPPRALSEIAWWPAELFGGLRELTAHEAALLAARADVQVVQVAASWRETRALPGVRFVAPDALISRRLLRDAREGPVLVVGDDAASALHFAARLARAGAPRVAVIASQETRWREALAGGAATPEAAAGI